MTDNTITSLESDEYDPIVTTSSNEVFNVSSDIDFSDDLYVGVSTASANSTSYFVDTTNYGEISIDTSNYPSYACDGAEFVDFTLSDVPPTPTPGIQKDCPRKYKEDESIKALQDYISTTYGGHYTSEQNNVQTLDLIESVGDAESFCRSNAIKYLSRYDKKGQAKRDILKAMHYCLLLYYFSGHTNNETPTRGYETF